MESACWFEWDDASAAECTQCRVYLGNESCQSRLPGVEYALNVARRLSEAGKVLTLVTPFLTDEGLQRATALVDALSDVLPGVEVVCNDWGLLDVLASGGRSVPVAGRLLFKQDTDPRIAMLTDREHQSGLERQVTHADGTRVLLRYAPPPESLVAHVRSPSPDCPEVFDLLTGMGVSRSEISNVLQGLDLKAPSRWHVTLHVPDVLVAIARHCGVPDDGRAAVSSCGSGKCCDAPVVWRHGSFPVPLYHVNNAVYYLNERIPECRELQGIDRIVVRPSAARWTGLDNS